jgi:hypothetical protein
MTDSHFQPWVSRFDGDAFIKDSSKYESEGRRMYALVSSMVTGLVACGLTAGISPVDVPQAPPSDWWADPCRDYEPPTDGIGRKTANVVVVNYNPVIEAEGGKKLTEVWQWNDPATLTREVTDSIRTASGGYINYRIVKWIEVDGCPPWRSGFRYDDAGIMDVLRTQQWAQGDGTSYRRVFEENGITREYVDEHNITEVWLWGAPGFHWDEYAMFIPDRQRRLPPTSNPWFYRPYDIPDLGRTMWVMGWNYERGLDCALESYAHRCEGILALVMGNGHWDKQRAGQDPWNTWSMCDVDFPGHSGCGNAHVPPNGERDYDYGNLRSVESFCEDWRHWPQVAGKQVTIDGTQWDRDHAKYLTWWMNHFPKTRVAPVGAGTTGGSTSPTSTPSG